MSNADSPEDGALTRQDSDTAAVVETLNQHQLLKDHDQRGIEWLELTGKELKEMIDEYNSTHCAIEYFDMKYWAEETMKVWKDRTTEGSPGRKEGSSGDTRIFSNDSSLLKARDAQVKREIQQDRNGENFALRHPLLHRKGARNEERREIFRRAAVERFALAQPSSPDVSAISTTPNDKSQSNTQTSIYVPQPSLFPKSKQQLIPNLVKTPEESSLTKIDGGPSKPAGARLGPTSGDVMSRDSRTLSTPSRTAAAAAIRGGSAPESLEKLLEDQRQHRLAVQRHDEEVYRPVLAAFNAYDKAVQEKMTKLLEMVENPKRTYE